MNAWLATIVGESAAPIVGFILLFILVIALLLLVFAVLRRITGGTFVAGGRNRQVRLSVTDAAAVDNRRRLVLVRRDDVEHLILIGGPSDVVIEQNIRQFARQQRAEPAASTAVSEPEKPEPRASEEPRGQQQRAVPAAPPTQPPSPPVQAAPPSQVQRPLAPQPEAQRTMRAPEPPKQAEAAKNLSPIPPAQPVPPVSRTPDAAIVAPGAAPMVAAPARDAPARDNGWQRTASPSFGTSPRAEPKIDTPEPATSLAATETRTTTATAFPFAAHRETASPVYREPTIEGPLESEEPEITLGDMDFSDAFETDLGSELNIAPGKDEKPEKIESIEDEMERLLGDLSRPEKR
ncbi:flagellar biosynthetic protein FliO [Phyllobacterium endophyticum]|uniref:Flagellar biosynthesis protein FliO n=1 Tax=Phyllobacterium endophyticum TaxID=1149773 RepID=A0A2P7AU51_9HYPH|nr:flagellar biosynthetic protein FliO [Phyllobacterium endophyticum]MBB3234196.1 flagellar biogenesis protein FliO [Phyllobacterium endophyticum]PSH57750.1 hypothetical protein CU100_08500 [Phyllobacterium endophyticum]TYR43948.1 hypothetical protein FY050_01875 [Phyllobacterium endophyticum]